jgi:hypothetical protein
MGLAKWFARRGAVGGTARWAANGYRFFREPHPDPEEDPDSVIFRLMIAHRYEVIPNEAVEQRLMRAADEGRGLLGLTQAVLTEEANLTDNDPSVIPMLMDVIVEELDRKGIPREVIFGAGPDRAAIQRRARERHQRRHPSTS